MQDNFNIHSWKLKQAINELEEKQCPDCGCKMEGTMCNECGYMEEGKSTSTNDLVVRWTKKYLDIEKEDPYFYTEKGLEDGFTIINGHKVKEIIGYDEDDNDYVIGHIYSKTKKDIENEYSEEDLDNAFTNALASMKEEATFTNKHDDDPKLKGGQKKLPDELQAKILNKEAATPLADLYDLVSELVKQGISKDEILRIVNFATASSINEGEDHEVAMAQASLKAIVSAASQLMSKVGDNERNIPGWIQDHITNAENYIEQANQGFHELEPAVKDVDVDALDMVAEGVSDDLKTKAKNALAIHLRSAMADKNQDHVEEIKDARDRINNAKSVDELANILGEFGYEDDEIEDILG